jgi:hypothetical protein
LRGSGDKAAGRNPLHLVSAWACEARLTLGQIAVDGKSNEITAIPLLLELLDLKGATVTIDAEIAALGSNGLPIWTFGLRCKRTTCAATMANTAFGGSVLLMGDCTLQ